jgi:sensor histidine kinase YesM
VSGEYLVIKKLFDWTPRDISYWEKIHQKGLRYFIGWYGVAITGGLFFLIFGTLIFISWLRQVSGKQLSQTSWIFLVGQLLFVALVCLAAGVINSLVTWVVEERLYRKYKACDQGDLPV